MSLHDVRRDYEGDPLPDRIDDPWAFFGDWLRHAIATEQEGTAMTLATVSPEGWPGARVVLLKEFSPDGLVFFTNLASAKGSALSAHPVACGSFWWPNSFRQVRATGPVAELDRADVEAYFATRPRASQIEAWASRQSDPIDSRDDLLAEYAEVERRYVGQPVPCPPEWGGYQIDVDEFEFWQGMPGRLHDRLVSRREADAWVSQRLQP